jgi:hypothetical protein
MVDDERANCAFCRFQFQPQLILQGFEKCGAVRVRLRNTWWPAKALRQLPGRKLHSEVKRATEFGAI